MGILDFDRRLTASLSLYERLSESVSPNLFLRKVAQGAAMNKEENVPIMRPISSARANSRNVTAPIIPEPTTSTETTGSIDVMLVLTERMKT